MAAEQFDAVVIGSGQGGNPLAKAMAKHGWKTAVLERRFAGGTCVNDGCTPSKTVDASARVAYLARRGADFGVDAAGITIRMGAVWQRKQDLVLSSRENNRTGLEREGVTFALGEASFAEKQPGGGVYALDVALPGGGLRSIVTPRVFLNTGERPHPPALAGLDAVPYLDSTSILELQQVPAHLIVLGAGYIALEFAQMFLRFGARVTVLERGARLLPHEDEDVAACLREILAEDGIEFVFNAEAVRAGGDDGDVTVQVKTAEGERTVRGSHLLVATGRTPNVEPLHLERVGVRTAKGGYVEVNARLETSAPGIWALGDVKGPPAFTHVSYDDFRILRANLLEGGSRSTADRLNTSVMYTDPELGRVGLSEAEAAQQGLAVRVAAVPMRYMARAGEMAEPRGMLKALVDAGSERIVGACVLGVDGGEVAAQLQIAMMGGLSYTALRDGIFAHPTKAEVLNTLFGSFRDGKA